MKSKHIENEKIKIECRLKVSKFWIKPFTGGVTDQLGGQCYNIHIAQVKVDGWNQAGDMQGKLIAGVACNGKAQTIGSRSVFPVDPRIHFCNGYFEVCLFRNYRNNVLLKIVKLFKLAISLFHMTIKISN